MEHLAATVFETNGFHVETSWPFEDSESGKSREIDLRAIKPIHLTSNKDAHVFIEFLVECKASSSPFVFIERRKNQREMHSLRFEQFVFKKKRYEKAVPGGSRVFWPSEFYELHDHYYLNHDKKASQFTKVVRKGDKWVANHDGIYDSLILPIAKATAQRTKQHREVVSHYKNPVAFLTFPCVVLPRSLVVIDALTENDLREADQVSFVRNFDSGPLQGEVLIDFVSTNGLAKHIEACELFGQHVLSKLELP